MTEGRPSKCTSPARASVRITASLGNDRLASFSFTVKVASEPMPTTKVTPSISPMARSVAGSGSAGADVAVGGAGVSVGGGGAEVGVGCAVSVGPGGAEVAVGSGAVVAVGCGVAVGGGA